MSSAETAAVSTDEAGAAGDRDGVARVRGLECAEVSEVGLECVVDLAGDVALEAAEDLELGLSFGRAAARVGARARAVAQAADGDQVQGAVGLAVAAVVEAVAGGLARGCGDWAGAAEGSEGCFAVEAVDVLPGGDE